MEMQNHECLESVKNVTQENVENVTHGNINMEVLRSWVELFYLELTLMQPNEHITLAPAKYRQQRDWISQMFTGVCKCSQMFTVFTNI